MLSLILKLRQITAIRVTFLGIMLAAIAFCAIFDDDNLVIARNGSPVGFSAFDDDHEGEVRHVAPELVYLGFQQNPQLGTVQLCPHYVVEERPVSFFTSPIRFNIAARAPPEAI